MLLADFHIHTTWSDGKLDLPEVIDLFGRSGHDVIAITDHVVNQDSMIGKVTHRLGVTVTSESFRAYREQIECEKKRAWDEYGMIVLPGFELTQDIRNRYLPQVVLGRHPRGRRVVARSALRLIHGFPRDTLRGKNPGREQYQQESPRQHASHSIYNRP